MKRLYVKLILLITALMASPLVFADGNGPIDLTPPRTDQSQSLLSSVFGSVNNVLPSDGGSNSAQLLGAMFGTFNAAVIFLGAVVVFYMLMASTLNTAQDGEILGRRWSSIWIPVRSASGIALLIPKASGYNLIQIAVMWIVVQGIGAADSVWNTALDNIQQDGGMVAPPMMNSIQLLNPAQNMFEMQVCRFAYDQSYEDSGQNKTIQMQFIQGKQHGGKHYNGYQFTDGHNDYCGTVTWTLTGDPMVDTQTQEGILTALNQMAGPAQRIVYSNSPEARNAMAINQGMQDMRTGINNVLREESQTAQGKKATAFVDQAKKNGWLMAGRYYYDIAKENNELVKNLPTISAQAVSQDDLSKSQKEILAPAWNNAQVYINNNLDNTTETAGPGQNGKVTFNYGQGQLSGKSKIIANIFTLGLINLMTTWINNVTGKAVNDAKQQYNHNLNPVIAVQNLGQNIEMIMQNTWLTGMVTIESIVATKAIVGGVLSFFDPGAGKAASYAIGIVANILQWFKTMVTPFMTILFIAGAGLADYFPLIPYVLFTLASLGWFFGVVEAMVAAPIVALGIMAPEGHEAVGRAGPGLMLLVAIFLRPTLMVMGLIAGMMLSYIAVDIVNYGFSGLLDSVFGNSFNIIESVALVAIYVMLIVTMLSKTFSLIHMLPEKVLRWIGAQANFGIGEEQAEAKVGGVVKQGNEKMAGAAGGAYAGGEAMAGAASSAIDGAIGANASAGGGAGGGSTDLEVGQSGGGNDVEFA